MRTLLLAVVLAGGCGPMAELGLVKPKPKPDGLVHQYMQGSAASHANVYWIDTPAGPVVVDVPLTASDAKKLRKEMAQPYRIYVTQATPERFASLAAMRNPDVAAYTTPAIATEIQQRGDQRLAAARKRAGDDVPGHVEPPAPTVEERTRDMVGEVELELIPLGPAAVETSLVVFVPKTGELIAGDVVAGKEHLDLTWGRSKVWQDRIAELKALEPKLVYPGHGTPGGPELLDETLAYLKFFHDAVADHVRQGKPARIGNGDAGEIKRQIVARYPKLGRADLLDRSIAAEYGAQLAELGPATTPDTMNAANGGGAPTANGAAARAKTANGAQPAVANGKPVAATPASAKSADAPAESQASDAPAGFEDLTGGDTSGKGGGKTKKKKAKK